MKDLFGKLTSLFKRQLLEGEREKVVASTCLLPKGCSGWGRNRQNPGAGSCIQVPTVVQAPKHLGQLPLFFGAGTQALGPGSILFQIRNQGAESRTARTGSGTHMGSRHCKWQFNVLWHNPVLPPPIVISAHSLRVSYWEPALCFKIISGRLRLIKRWQKAESKWTPGLWDFLSLQGAANSELSASVLSLNWITGEVLYCLGTLPGTVSWLRNG